MTDARGPDFLPYPLPQRTVAPATQVVPPPEQPGGSRWLKALDGLTPWGIATVTAAVFALLALLVVSLVTDHRRAGAVFATTAAVIALSAGLRALRDEQPADSATVVRVGMGTGAASAVLALLLLLVNHSSVAEQPPIRVPSPAPSTSPSPQPQQPTPTPSTTPSTTPQPGGGTTGTPSPGPRPSLGVLPPGSTDLFGVPTQPDPPTTEATTDRGLLTGKVVTTSGAPLQGASVSITRADPSDTSDSPGCPLKVALTSKADGTYRVPLCQLGDGLGYHVVISSGTASVETDLFVNAGQTTVYNVILAVRHA